MHMRLVAVGMACAMTGCLITPVMHFGEGKSASESQHAIVSEHVAPSSFERSHWAGEISSVRIRVWADDAYRAQNVRWQQTFEDQIEYANEILGGLFGVRLVAELRTWPRAAPDATLEDDLRALAEIDPGDDAMTVVGLTSSLPLVAATFEQLGLAEVGGHHMMLRGYADLEERKTFDRVFTELRPDERELLYQARRRHKTTGVLLHELGHNLGAEHVADEDTLMHDSYSEHASKYDPHSREVILASLDRRVRRGPAAAATTGPAGSPDAAPAVAKASAPRAPAKPLVVDLDASGMLTTAGKPLSDAQLDELLAATASANRATEVVVRYARQTPRDKLSATLERVQAAGLRSSFSPY
jgi:hypothetical protein